MERRCLAPSSHQNWKLADSLLRDEIPAKLMKFSSASVVLCVKPGVQDVCRMNEPLEPVSVAPLLCWLTGSDVVGLSNGS